MNVAEQLADAMMRVEPENVQVSGFLEELESIGLGPEDPVNKEMEDLEDAKLWGVTREQLVRRRALVKSYCNDNYSACWSEVMRTGRPPGFPPNKELPDFSKYGTPATPK